VLWRVALGSVARLDHFQIDVACFLVGDTPTIYAGANITGDSEKNDATDKPQVFYIEINFVSMHR